MTFTEIDFFDPNSSRLSLECDFPSPNNTVVFNQNMYV